VKKASPSGHCSAVGVDEAVSAYRPVTDAISVLTDTPFFGGSLEDLRTARNGFDGPILAKDFIIDPRQVAEARLHGADAVLAILSLLNDPEAASVMPEARRLGMDVIVEVHDEFEVGRAMALPSEIIGINNRDLRTLETDLSVSERLSALVPDDRIVISESGIRSRRDVEQLSAQVDAFLVGSSLMAANDVAFAARSLVHGPVKICGLTNAEDVTMAAEAGTTHAGFIFAENSRRKVDGSADRLVAAARDFGLRAVGVFQNQSRSVISQFARNFSLDAVQLHETELDLCRLREELPQHCEIWAVCGADKSVEPARDGANRTLFDTCVRGHTGGTGKPFDWSLVSGRPDLPNAFIAGGIGAANARAAQQVGAFGIDVGSAIETAPGRKDPDKIRALFAAVRPVSRRTAQC
jgi:indole-3-glycerol phosphate synthase/phosphoribosylanthranilate isomerase